MATYHDLNMEWSALCQECPDCWTKSGKICCFNTSNY